MQPDLSQLRVGSHVIFVDPVAIQHDALVTAVWGEIKEGSYPPCINVVVVNRDEAMQDTYGRQIARHTSVSHRSVTSAHGMYYMMPGDTPNPIVEASQK